MNEHQPCRCEIGKNYPGVPHTHSRPSRLVELVDAVGPTPRPQARNPHADTYAPGDWNIARGDIARRTRRDIARERAEADRVAHYNTFGLAFATFGPHAQDDAARGHHDTTGAETTARKVDALYRAHLLRAASDRIIRRPRGSTGAYFTSRSGAAIAAYAAARTQEIRAEHTDPAAARVAVLIARARV